MHLAPLHHQESPTSHIYTYQPNALHLTAETRFISYIRTNRNSDTLPTHRHSSDGDPTCGQHPLPGRTLAVADARVVVLFEVVARLALALAVPGGRALALHHLVASAHGAAQALGDVVPHLRVGALRTRGAVALLRGRAASAHVAPRRTAVTRHGHAGRWVRVFEGEERRAGEQSHLRSHQEER